MKNSDIIKCYAGDQEVVKLLLGTEQIYPTSPGIVYATALTFNVPMTIEVSAQTSVSYSPLNADVDLVYSSSAPSLADIDNNGFIEVYSEGSVTFEVTDNNSQLSDQVTSVVLPPPVSEAEIPLTIEILSGHSYTSNSGFYIKDYGAGMGKTFYYRCRRDTRCGDWIQFNPVTSAHYNVISGVTLDGGMSDSFQPGDKIEFVGQSMSYGTSSGPAAGFAKSGGYNLPNLKVYGNPMSLIWGDYYRYDDYPSFANCTWNDCDDYTFKGLFNGLGTNMPGTRRGLIEAELYFPPYSQDNPIPTGCFDNLFSGCTILEQVKCTYPEGQTFSNWLAGVNSTGTFIKDANATWQSGDSGIPTGWTTVNG